jgi:hypothetical protein
VCVCVCVCVCVQELNDVYSGQGAVPCMALEPQHTIEQGPCDCRKCVTPTSVAMTQVQFVKNRQHGFVETRDIVKHYQLVFNKRWLCPRHNDIDMPFGTTTLPFGYQL